MSEEKPVKYKKRFIEALALTNEKLGLSIPESEIGNLARETYHGGQTRKEADGKEYQIFVREDGLAKTYKMILTYHNSGDFPIESGMYKPTGLKMGDIVTFDSDEQEGKITGVEGALRIKSAGYGTAPVYRDVNEVTKKSALSNQLSFEDLLKGGT